MRPRDGRGGELKHHQSVAEPTSYHDPLSREYGHKRFGHIEGLHGVLETRFGLIKHKRWYRRRSQARLDVAMVFCALHALAMEQRFLRGAAALLGGPPAPGGAPPGPSGP